MILSGFVALSVTGKIVGANFLFVTPSGVLLMFFSNLGVLGSSVEHPVQPNVCLFLQGTHLEFVGIPADYSF